ncbi:phosphotransferase family protein [Pantoea sp. PNA 03-3]|uniref:phosphotransferase family protein n=1 Tax=Pantoea sp. PNA 03-3 TaxID=2135460 RepID=UPI000D984C59|nr:phosphotransferase [Pantoea sp. PNA 03-3]PXV76586.1 phosphotransferase family enzyme [Pantoea sp. PNA 03-3]
MTNADLAKMGIARVKHLANKDGKPCAIEKAPVSEVEYAFYCDAAPLLARHGILTPVVKSACYEQRKLILEYIPEPIQQDAVTGDAFLSVLARLHSVPPDPSWTFSTHRWDEAALESCLDLLRLPAEAERQLRAMQKHSNVLFEPYCMISGDTNAGNWGKRENGELVLFDWERFGLGSPAIDLAPLVKGMGREEDYRAIARRYCQLHSRFDADVLAKEIALAKAWIVNEVVVILSERRRPELVKYLGWYGEVLPEWLGSIRLKMNTGLP